MPTYKGIGQPFGCSASATVILSVYALAGHQKVNLGHLILNRVPTPGCSFFCNALTLLLSPSRQKQNPNLVFISASRLPESHSQRPSKNESSFFVK